MTSETESQSPSKDSVLIQSLYVQPDIRRGRITVYVDTASPCKIQLSIPELGVSCDANPGKNTMPMDGFDSWTPEQPKTYELSCSAESGDGCSESCSLTFGMREFSVKEDRFFFNSRPLYVKGMDCTGIRGHAPLGDAQREEISTCFQSLKDAGFNLIRVSVSDLTSDLLTLADAIGLLVEVEFRSGTELDGIAMFRNHPSTVCWNLLAVEKPDVATVQETDPSRVCLYSDSRTGDARCVRPYRDDDPRIDVLSIAHRAPANRRSQSYCQHTGDASTLSYVTHLEVGGLALDEAGSGALDRDLLDRELNKIIPDGVKLPGRVQAIGVSNLQCLVDSIRTNGSIAGYCVSVRDAAARRDADVSEAVREITPLTALKLNQAPTRPLITIGRNNLVPREEMPVKVHFLNEDKLEGRADLSLQVVGPTNQVLWKKKRGVRLPKSGRLLWEGAIAASGSTGKHRFIVRIMQNMRCISEASVDFFVYPPVDKWDRTVNLLDPEKRWGDVCTSLVSSLEFKSPMHIIPPINNSIRAYPDNDLAQILGQVNEGAVALFFQPPQDWNDFARHIDPELEATSVQANSVYPSLVHYAKSHPVFDSLPSRSIMGATYGQLMPTVTFQELSEEDICGCYRGGSSGEDACWGSNILVKKYGSGQIVFISLPIMEQLGQNPVADHLFVNLIKHFVRRSIPSQEGSFSVHQRSVEWIRQQRQDFTQNWALLGMFPYTPDVAKAPAYPPEDSVELDGTYPGWYRALSWKSWFPIQRDGYEIDMDEALGPEFVCGPTSDYGIAYAYAEVIGETRGEMRLVVDPNTRMDVWMNGSLVYSSVNSGDDEPSVYMKLGKNTVLVKLYKAPGPFRFKLAFEAKKDPVQYRWWK